MQKIIVKRNITTFAKKEYSKVLVRGQISKEITEAQYAVRGAIPNRGAVINDELERGVGAYHFSKTTACNIGNPQAVGQGSITFNREVLAAAVYPELLNTNAISDDAKNRAEHILSNLQTGVGAYCANSKGHPHLRQLVSNYIERRDGPAVSADQDKIYLTNGASEGVRMAFKMLIRDKNDGIMVPIPQYPLYSAQITLDGGTLVEYYLDEEEKWGIHASDIETRIIAAKDKGINLRAMVAINPGNPTGNVLSRKNIEDMIKLAYEHKILILADEVYQSNIYTPEEAPFLSFRKVLAELGEPYASDVELISLHSVSKGLQGECGLRGGYFELHNLDKFAEELIFKLKSIELCANNMGQIACGLMVDPPKEGVESQNCIDIYKQQTGFVFDGLRERAGLLTSTFNGMENMSCNDIEGAMYAFPRIHFSEKALKAAERDNVAPDFMFCLDMLDQTGIMTVPGSGFGQKEGEYHFRITNLVTPTSNMMDTLDSLKNFNEQFIAKYV